MWPSEKTASSLYDFANIGLIIGLGVGIVATVLIVWMGGVKERYLQQHLTDTNERAAQANERASEADERAAQANLALAKLKAPRTLNVEQQALISDALKPFGKQQFDVAISVMDEPKTLLPMIESALRHAGWQEIDWKGNGNIAEITYTREGSPMVGIVPISGVVVQMHPEKVKELFSVAQALAAILNKEGIDAKAESGLGFQMATLPRFISSSEASRNREKFFEISNSVGSITAGTCTFSGVSMPLAAHRHRNRSTDATAKPLADMRCCEPSRVLSKRQHYRRCVL